MQIQQERYTEDRGWITIGEPQTLDSAQLVFLFGETSLFEKKDFLKEIKGKYPDAHLIGCTTSGEIARTEVYDDSVIATALYFEKTKIKVAKETLYSMENSYSTGRSLADSLDHNELAHVLVFSDGLNVNGTELVKGLSEALPENVAVTGGLAGDQDKFKQTYVLLNKDVDEKMVVICGLYGSNIKIGYGSVGGWDSFGVDRLVTKSNKNVLYELDGKPALDLYKEYLGEQAKDLPASGLLFPLSVKQKGSEDLVRTILSVNEEEKSMTFAGDIPEGSYARLMKANFDRLITGAAKAASDSSSTIQDFKPEFALLISCVGRKLVLKQRIEEEVESVQNMLGIQTTLAGFYSYGEICPTTPTSKQCQLHNQTMTITIMKEI